MPAITIPLNAAGPLLPIVVGAHAGRIHALQLGGLPIPDRQQINALIDTGATSTALDPRIIRALGLVPRGQVKVRTGVGVHLRNQYDIALWLPVGGVVHAVSHALPVIESNLAGAGFDALLGRDVLQACTLFYNGPNQSLTIGI